MTVVQIDSVVPSISEARQRGQDVWDLFLRGFGSPVSPASSEVFQVDGVQSFPTVYGISIGPRSHVDRCWILWDPLATVSLPDSEVDPTKAKDFIRRVSVTTPLLFTQSGNEATVVMTSTTIGGIRVAPRPLSFYGLSTSFVTDEDNVVRPDSYVPFGGATTALSWNDATDQSGGDAFWNPVLHLQFWLRPPTSQVPTARVPFFATVQRTITGGAEFLVAVFPVHGRHKVRVSYSSNTTGGQPQAGNLRVGGFSPATRNGFIPTENTIATAAVTSGAGTVVIDPVLYDYIAVYFTSTSADGICFCSAFAVDY